MKAKVNWIRDFFLFLPPAVPCCCSEWNQALRDSVCVCERDTELRGITSDWKVSLKKILFDISFGLGEKISKEEQKS